MAVAEHGHYGDAVSTGRRQHGREERDARRAARRATAAAGAVLALIGASVILPLLVPSAPWTTGPAATCVATGCFCEAVAWHTPVRQPVAAVSSLAFSVTAVAVLLTWARAARLGRARMPGPWLAAFAAGCALVGVGSAYLHGSFTFLGQFADVAPMQATALFLFCYARRGGPGWPRWGLPAYLVLAGLAAAAAWWLPDTRRYLFLMFIVLGVAAEFARYRLAPPGRLALSFGVFGLAGVAWVLDGTGLCAPDSPLQGHALWHVLGAVAAYLLFLHYQDEANHQDEASGRGRPHETTASNVYRM